MTVGGGLTRRVDHVGGSMVSSRNERQWVGETGRMDGVEG